MSPVHHERTFEGAVVGAMVAAGWQQATGAEYNRELALDTARLFEFIGATQGDAWSELLAKYGLSGDEDPSTAQRGFAKRLRPWHHHDAT